MRFFLTETSMMDEIGNVAEKELGILEQYMTDSLPKLLDFAIDVILAIIVFAIGTKVIKWLVKIVKSSMERANVEQGVLTFIGSLLKYVLYFVLILIILSIRPRTAPAIIATTAKANHTSSAVNLSTACTSLCNHINIIFFNITSKEFLET